MSGGGRGPVSDINVMPYIDVMLVLLIIFMVTAPLVTQGVDVELPKIKAAPLQGTENKLVLTLTKDKKIFIGKSETTIPFAELETKLKANAKLQAEKEIFLHADRRLEYGYVVDVLAILKRSGAEKLGMVTDPLDQPKPSK